MRISDTMSWVSAVSSEELITKQAEMVYAQDPGLPGYAPRVWAYRNTIKALNWYSSVREKLDDPKCQFPRPSRVSCAADGPRVDVKRRPRLLFDLERVLFSKRVCIALVALVDLRITTVLRPHIAGSRSGSHCCPVARADASWFIKFKGFSNTPYPGGQGKSVNGTFHVPTCDWYDNGTAPRCSGFYHDQEQTRMPPRPPPIIPALRRAPPFFFCSHHRALTPLSVPLGRRSTWTEVCVCVGWRISDGGVLPQPSTLAEALRTGWMVIASSSATADPPTHARSTSLTTAEVKWRAAPSATGSSTSEVHVCFARLVYRLCCALPSCRSLYWALAS